MAKGINNSIMRGKRGNSVMYKLTNSNNNETQGERVYVAKVANPKTVSQAMQRMKMTPAVNFYRAFKTEILDHSYEGVKYGGRSHARFMKLAMSMTSGFPFMEKGDNSLVGGNYVIADGSLPTINFTYNAENHRVVIPKFELGETEVSTIGDFSQALFNNDSTFKNGDQITFVAVLRLDEGLRIPRVARLVLNASSTEIFDDVMLQQGIILNTEAGEVSYPDTLTGIRGFGIILSRPVISRSGNSVSWLRSRAVFDATIGDLTPTSPYNTQEGYEAALKSYMTTSKNPISDYYLNHGKLAQGSGDYPDAPITD